MSEAREKQVSNAHKKNQEVTARYALTPTSLKAVTPTLTLGKMLEPTTLTPTRTSIRTPTLAVAPIATPILAQLLILNQLWP